MRRTELVVPADRLAALRIPPLAVTTGAPAPEWADVPMSAWRFKRRPALRLPLDPAAAERARRYARSAVWLPAVAVVLQLAWAAVLFGGLTGTTQLVALVTVAVALIGLHGVPGGGLPRQTPYRTRSGGVRIPGVPVEVAERWIELNPGVTATDDPAPRPHSRRFYATWSTVLLVGAAGLASILATNGREDFILLPALVPVLIVAGAATAWRLLPPGYVALDRSAQS